MWHSLGMGGFNPRPREGATITENDLRALCTFQSAPP